MELMIIWFDHLICQIFYIRSSFRTSTSRITTDGCSTRFNSMQLLLIVAFQQWQQEAATSQLFVDLQHDIHISEPNRHKIYEVQTILGTLIYTFKSPTPLFGGPNNSINSQIHTYILTIFIFVITTTKSC